MDDNEENESPAAFFAKQWREMYNALIAEGFAEREALDLLKTYINATCSWSKR